MSQLKKVLITVPDTLLEQVDRIVDSEKRYIAEKKKLSLREQMKKGYQEMAELNLSIAAMCFDAENEQFSKYEEKLAECE